MMSNVPKLRFKEFSGEWEDKRLSTFSTKSNNKNKDESITDVFTNSAVNGIVSQRDFFDKDIANQNNLGGYYIVSNNDFIYNPRISTSAPVGPLNRNHLGTGVMSPLYTVFTVQEDKVSLDYLERYFKSSKWYKYMCNIANYGARSDRMNITNNDFFSMPIPLPSKQEQEKIASFLTSVDTKIEQLSRKEELLKEYKKGVMQKIFSGELRFKADDGSEFPEWEEKKLGDICKITTGKLDANAMVENGQYRFYTCAKDYFQIDNYAFDTDALIVSGNGANVGYIHHFKGKFNAYQRTYVLDEFKDNIYFLKYVLDKYLYRRIMKEKNEGNTPYIVMGTLADMKVHLPALEEQTKIANFLSSIDIKIEQTKSQLDSTKEFKKALLQQMFV
jgi:type I restriction enzyme S subunit